METTDLSVSFSLFVRTLLCILALMAATSKNQGPVLALDRNIDLIDHETIDDFDLLYYPESVHRLIFTEDERLDFPVRITNLVADATATDQVGVFIFTVQHQ